MNAKAAPSAAPPYAATMWMDHTNIYMEIAAKDGGPPYIATYSCTEGGLSKALAMMRDLFMAAQPIGGRYTIPHNPMIKKANINNFSEAQREAARLALRKAGII